MKSTGRPILTRHPSRFWSTRRGVVALEFALVAIPFFMMVLGCMEIGYDMFVQAVLDTAVESAARSVQTGTTQGTAGQTSAQFAANAVCPATGGLLKCSLITVGVTPLATGTNYYTTKTSISFATAGSAGGSVCTGTAGRLMLLQAWYAGPTFVGSLIPLFATTVGGSVVHITTASAGFVNEAFTGGQTTGVGC